MHNPSELYPTPPWLAREMAEKLGIFALSYGDRAFILDPAAGTGALLEACTVERNWSSRWSYDPMQNIDRRAIEIEPELRAILEDKGFPVVGTDFLTYVPQLMFTHIIMNPPFSKAADFVLRAWEILVSGTLVTLYPATALAGKTAKERLVLDIIEQNGGEIKELGAAFAKAERPTNAEIAMITLRKGADLGEIEFDVRNTRPTTMEWTEEEGASLVHGGFIRQLLEHADAAIGAYGEYSRQRKRIERYLAPFPSTGQKSILEQADGLESASLRYNTFVQELTASAWNVVLNHPRLQMLLTDRARKMLDAFRTKQRRVDFNEENVRAFFAALMNMQDELLDACVQDAFDTMTKWHKENRIHVEGWKSNEAWKVTKKVVLPGYVERWGTGSWHISYRRQQELVDIDRAICVVTNRPFDKCLTVAKALEEAFGMRVNRPPVVYSTFFQIRYYQKGTIHLRFLDDAVWEQFNIAAARGRKWVGGGFS